MLCLLVLLIIRIHAIAVVSNELEGEKFTCDPSLVQCFATGEAYLSFYGWSASDKVKKRASHYFLRKGEEVVRWEGGKIWSVL